MNKNTQSYNNHSLKKIQKTIDEGLNQLSEDKFKVLGQCLTYQDFFKEYDLEKSIRLFYSL